MFAHRRGCGWGFRSREAASALAHAEMGDRHAGRDGFPHEINLRRGEGVGPVDEVAEGALQVQGFGGEGAGGFDGAGVVAPQRLKIGGGLVSIVRTLRCSRSPRTDSDADIIDFSLPTGTRNALAARLGQWLSRTANDRTSYSPAAAEVCKEKPRHSPDSRGPSMHRPPAAFRLPAISA